jgi:transposase
LEDPMSGAVFVFRNRRRTSVKVLVYDGQGFWLCQKRLSKDKFLYWPAPGDKAAHRLLSHELSVLLSAGDPSATKAAPLWRQV